MPQAASFAAPRPLRLAGLFAAIAALFQRAAGQVPLSLRQPAPAAAAEEAEPHWDVPRHWLR